LRRILLRLEFDGGPHCGWQIQGHELPSPTVPLQNKTSIQFELEKAVSCVLRWQAERVFVIGCGRTDSGVHAKEYFCHFDIPEGCLLSIDSVIDLEKLRHSLNSVLPDSVAVTAAYFVPENFSAIENVKTKTYEHRILLRRAKSVLDKGRVFWIPAQLETFRVEETQKALHLLEGEHDFAAFQAAHSDVKSTLRTLYEASLIIGALDFDKASGHYLSFLFTGNGFLKHMVRNLVGTLVEIGQNKRNLDSMNVLLGETKTQKVSRMDAGFCAPPEGLYLKKVNYGEGVLGEFEQTP